MGDSNWSDYTISFDLTSTDDDGIGAIFRYQDNNNYLRFIMVRDPSNKGQFRRIDKIVDGKPFQILAVDDKNSFEINKTYKIKIEVFGSSIKVFMDDSQILSTEDSTFKTGKVGLMTYASSGYFDNFCVSSKNGDSSTQNKDKPSSDVLTIILQIDNPYMTVNGVKKEIDPGRGTVPVIVKGRTLVPIRAIIEEMGGEILWDSGERKVTIKLKTTTIELWIDKKSAKVNGALKDLDVPPTIINGRTMLPLRFVAENLGCEVLWDGQTKTITIKYELKVEQEIVINKISSQGEKVIGPQGGELTLSDGTTLIVPPNSLKEDSKIKLTSIINPTFSSVDTLGFEIIGLSKLSGEITLKFQGEKGLNGDEYDIYGYIEERDERFEVISSYDSNSGLVEVKIKGQTENKNIIYPYFVLRPKNTAQSMGDKIWIYFGWSKEYTPKSSEKIMKLPYYEQTGGSCASTCTQMLLKGYTNLNFLLPEILSELKVSDNDFGINHSVIAGRLKDWISAITGFPVISIPQWNINNLRSRVLQELDKGHPVLIAYACKDSGKCTSGHVVLIIGYKNNGLELVIHDPSNISPPDNDDGTTYTIRDWNWIEKRRTTDLQRYQILYINGPFASQNFATITLPGNDETGGMCNGDLSFKVYNPNNKKYASQFLLQIKPSSNSAGTGLTWVDIKNKDINNKYKNIDIIPQEAEILNIKLYVYNSAFESKNLSLLTVIEHEDKVSLTVKNLSDNKRVLNLQPAGFNKNSRVEYSYEYKVEDIRDLTLSDKDGKLDINIWAILKDGDQILDFFKVKATINVLPKIKSIEPSTGKGGDIITIQGFSFGKNKSSKSKVMIGKREIEILSWSDKEIKVKLPEDIESGKVVVYTGEEFEYKSKEDIVFNVINIIGNLKDGIYIVRIDFYPKFDYCSGELVEGSYDSCFFKIELRKGVIKGLSYSDAYVIVTDTYVEKGNVKFNFYFKHYKYGDSFAVIVSGTINGIAVNEISFDGSVSNGKLKMYKFRDLLHRDLL